MTQPLRSTLERIIWPLPLAQPFPSGLLTCIFEISSSATALLPVCLGASFLVTLRASWLIWMDLIWCVKSCAAHTHGHRPCRRQHQHQAIAS